MNEIIKAEESENLLPDSARAIQITERIRANGRTAVNAVCAIGKDLRTMKIDKLYTQLGYEEFEDYAEKEFQLHRRQTYQYISVFEKLGEEFVQSNAQLGITKLALLATANPEDRAEVMESEDIQGMTTKELEDILDKYKQQGEQLSMLQEENTRLEARVEELEAEPKDVEIATKEVPVPDKETEEKLKKKTQELISANAEKESIQKELNAANAELQMTHNSYTKLRSEMEKKISEEVKKELASEKKKASAERKDLEEELKAKSEALESSKKELEQAKENYRKEIEKLKKANEKPAESSDKSSFKTMFASAYKEITGLIEFIKEADPTEQEIFVKKIYQLLDMSKDALKDTYTDILIESGKAVPEASTDE